MPDLFDKLPKESIDSYEDLRTAFRENYLQQTKHIKDPVEIHHIKQRDGESTEDFMERKRTQRTMFLAQKNLDIFAWKPADMTGVPRNIAEHRLNIREGYSPVRQKKRGHAPERNKVIQEEVEKLVDAGIR
ncbi:reverse transcriptase domain-containing protein [Tanacetum coccineum]